MAGCAGEVQPRLVEEPREEEQSFQGFQSYCVHPGELNMEFSGVDSQAPVPESVHSYCFIFLCRCRTSELSVILSMGLKGPKQTGSSVVWQTPVAEQP